MSEPRKNGCDFVLYLNSGNRGNHPLEPGVTKVCAAFCQELKIPLTLRADLQVAPLNLIYLHSYGNAVLNSPKDCTRSTAQGDALDG